MGKTTEFITEIGSSGINLLETLKFIIRGKISIGDTSLQMMRTGIDSLFIVGLTTAFIGLAAATQLAKEFQRYGLEHMLGGLVAISTVRELAPLITSIVITGRVGAGITAEIGSMKATEQIDALQVLGINPIKYLLVPRLISASIMTPLLTIISALISILAAMYLAGITVKLDHSVYLNSIRQVLEVSDVFIMMLKSMVFGAIIAVIATTTGLQVKEDAESVGNATTTTVVRSIILIFLFNYIITSIFF